MLEWDIYCSRMYYYNVMRNRIRLISKLCDRQNRRLNGQSAAAMALDLLSFPPVKMYCRTVSILKTNFSRITTVFALCVALISLCCKSSAADLVVSNNAIINIFGDSLMVDSLAPSVGYRFSGFPRILFSIELSRSQHLHVFNLGRSGGTMDDWITNNDSEERIGALGLPVQ